MGNLLKRLQCWWYGRHIPMRVYHPGDFGGRYEHRRICARCGQQL